MLGVEPVQKILAGIKMKTVRIIFNVIVTIMGVVFLVGGGSDIQLGFGCVLLAIGLNNLM